MSQQGWEAGKGCRNKCRTIVDAETAAAQEERIIEALLVDISKVVFTYRFSRQPLIREYLGQMEMMIHWNICSHTLHWCNGNDKPGHATYRVCRSWEGYGSCGSNSPGYDRGRSGTGDIPEGGDDHDQNKNALCRRFQLFCLKHTRAPEEEKIFAEWLANLKALK